MNRLLIIDGHAMIHRAYHALPPLTTKAGIPTNAIYGFFSMLYKAILDLQPDHLVICFDTPVPTFRKELLTTYQSQRPELPDDLTQQFKLIKELLDAAGIARVEAPGFEADDAIGTIAKRFASPTVEVLILTGDRDILQLVDEHINVIMPKIGLSQTVRFDEKAIEEKYFVKASQIADYKALMGDASDNYGGMKGIGPKTAVKILAKCGSIEELFKDIHVLQDPKLEAKFAEHQELVKLSKTIATIRQDVPVDISFEHMKLPPYSNELLETFKKYQMTTLQRRYFPETIEAPIMEAKPKKGFAPKEAKPQVVDKTDPSQMDIF